jgi:hypothetical protein
MKMHPIATLIEQIDVLGSPVLRTAANFKINVFWYVTAQSAEYKY